MNKNKLDKYTEDYIKYYDTSAKNEQTYIKNGTVSKLYYWKKINNEKWNHYHIATL